MLQAERAQCDTVETAKKRKKAGTNSASRFPFNPPTNFYIISFFPMNSGWKYKHSALSHFTSPFSMHIELYVWMPMASGLTRAFQASDAQAGDPSQLAGLPSNLPVTSANDRTRRNGYRNAAAYWQWQLQFTGKERLISSVQLPFPLREGKRDSRDWAGDNMSRQKSIFCSHPLTLSESLILSDSKCLRRQQGARAVKEKGQSRQRFDQTLILKVYMWTFQHFPHQYQEKKRKKMEEAAGTGRL